MGTAVDHPAAHQQQCVQKTHEVFVIIRSYGFQSKIHIKMQFIFSASSFAYLCNCQSMGNDDRIGPHIDRTRSNVSSVLVVAPGIRSRIEPIQSHYLRVPTIRQSSVTRNFNQYLVELHKMVIENDIPVVAALAWVELCPDHRATTSRNCTTRGCSMQGTAPLS